MQTIIGHNIHYYHNGKKYEVMVMNPDKEECIRLVREYEQDETITPHRVSIIHKNDLLIVDIQQ